MRRYLLALLPMPLATAALADPTTIDVGMVLGSNHGQVVNGWIDNGGGLYQPLGSTDHKCCYSLFEKDGQYLTVVSEAVARNPSGGIIAERVIATKIDRPNDGEEERSVCGPLSLDPLRSFYTPETKGVRSIFYDGSGFQELRWTDTDGRCDLPD